MYGCVCVHAYLVWEDVELEEGALFLYTVTVVVVFDEEWGFLSPPLFCATVSVDGFVVYLGVCVCVGVCAFVYVYRRCVYVCVIVCTCKCVYVCKYECTCLYVDTLLPEEVVVVVVVLEVEDDTTTGVVLLLEWGLEEEGEEEEEVLEEVRGLWLRLLVLLLVPNFLFPFLVDTERSMGSSSSSCRDINTQYTYTHRCENSTPYIHTHTHNTNAKPGTRTHKYI